MPTANGITICRKMSNLAISIYMDVIVFIISAVFSVLSIILFFKVWGMCNDVREMRLRSDEKKGAVSPEELTFLYRTNHPTFTDTLVRTIYLDLYIQYRRDNRKEADEWYQFKYGEWVKMCKNNGWEFPVQFVDVDTLDKFENVFIPKQRL